MAETVSYVSVKDSSNISLLDDIIFEIRKMPYVFSADKLDTPVKGSSIMVKASGEIDDICKMYDKVVEMEGVSGVKVHYQNSYHGAKVNL